MSDFRGRRSHYDCSPTARKRLGMYGSPSSGRDGLRCRVVPTFNGNEAETPTLIAVDTNVTLGYLLSADETQAERSRRVLEPDERILITDVVLAESVWTLIGRRYRTIRVDVATVVERLLQEPNVRFSWDSDLSDFSRSYRRGRLPDFQRKESSIAERHNTQRPHIAGQN